MANTTDRRIIQMQFENKKFEKNIAKSTKSVEDFKKAMNFEEVTSGMKKFAEGTKNLTIAGFDKLTNNIQKLTDKFTGLGTLSELVLSQIRRGIEHLAAEFSHFISSMTTAQVSAGMDKYNMLNKSVQTIKAATGESEETVYRVLERLNQYTDQTSYNFADMAQNIGKFTSVGIDLESAERQMEGIANWAARSGAGTQEASRAMYNLSQAMGVGKLTKIDWKSIENAGMATKEFKEQLIQSGIAAGTLIKKGEKIYTKKGNVEVTYQNMAETLQKGWATRAVLSNTLEKYYYEDLYYENEDQKALIDLSDTQKKEFDKMIASGKKLDAAEWKTLQNMGAITDSNKEKIVDLAVKQGKLTKEVTKDGKTIYKTVNKTGKQVEFTLDDVEKSLSSGWFDKSLADSATSINSLAKESYEAAQKCLTFTDVLNAWKDQVSSGWMTSMRLIFGDLSDAMEFFSNVCNRVGDGLGYIIDFRNEILKGWSEAGGRQSLIDILLGSEGGFFKTGTYGFLDMIEEAAGVIKKGLADFFYLFMDPVDRLSLKEDPDYIKTWMAGQLLRMTDGIKNFMNAIKKFLHEDITVNGKTTSRLAIIQDIVSGISGAMKLGYDIVTELIGFINGIGTDLSPGLQAIIGFFGDFGKSVYNTADQVGKENGIQKFFEGLRKDVAPITDSVNNLLISFADLLRIILGLNKEGTTHTGALASIGDFIRNIAQLVSSFAGPVIQFFADLLGAIRDLVSGNLSLDNLPAIGERIKTAFSKMISGLPEPVKKVIAYVKVLYNAIKMLFTNGFNARDAKKVGELLKKPFAKIFDLIPDTIKQRIGSIAEKIKGYFQKFWNKILAVWDSIIGKNKKTSGKNIVQRIVEPLTGTSEKSKDVVPSKSIFETIRDWIKEKFTSLLTFIQNLVGNAGGAANSFGQKISSFIEKLKQINLSKVLLWMMGGIGIGAFVLMIVKVFKAFKMFAKGISAIGDALKNGIDLKTNKKSESFGDKLLKIAGAIAILTACIVAIGNMDSGEALRGIMYVITLMVALGLMSHAMKEVYKDMDWKSGLTMLFGLIGIAIAMSSLTSAFVKLGQLNPSQFQQSIRGFVAVITSLIVVANIAKDGQFSFSNMSGLLAIALAIYVLISALNKIKNASIEQLITMGGSLVALLTILYVFMKFVSKNNISMANSGMTQMIALAGSIAILILALNMIKNARLDQLFKMAGSLIVILGILFGFMKFTSKMSMEGAGLVQLIALAGAIVLLMVAMIPLALLPIGRLAQAVGAVVLVMAALTGFIAITKNMTLAGSGLVQLIALAGAIVLLMVALIPLALLPFGKLMGAVLAVALIVTALAGFMILINRFDGGSLSGKGMVAFIAVAASIAILVWALMPLAALEPQQLLHFIGGMLSVMLGISLVIKMIKEMELKSAVGGLLVLLSLTVLVLAFASALHDLKDVNFAIILAFSAGLAIMCVGFAKAVEILSKLDPKKALKGIGLLAALLAAVGGVLALIGPAVINSIMGAIRDASGSLVLIADMIALFSERIGAIDEGNLEKAGRVIDQIVGIMLHLSGMFFQSGNVSAFMYAMSSLTLAADEIVKFDNKMSKVSADGNALKALGIITTYKEIVSNHLAGFDSYMGNASSFYDVMFKLGSAFDYFDGATKNISGAEDNPGFQLIKELAACAPQLNTIYKMDLAKFRTQLAELGGAMIIYAQGAKEVGGEKITEDTDVSGAVTLLRKISDALTKEGGFSIPDNMPTDSQLTTFGVQLAALAGALVKFEEAGGKLGDGKDKAIDTLTFFRDLKAQLDEMPNFGSDINTAIDSFKGEGGEFVKSDELTIFAEDIAKLGSAMAHFAESTQIVDEETGEVKPIDFSLATTALESIAGLGEKLPEFGGLKEAIFGRRETLGELSIEVNLLGNAIGNFYRSTTDFSATNGAAKPFDFGTENTGVLGFLNSIADIQNKLPTVRSFSLQSLFENEHMSFGELSTQLTLLGGGLKEISAAVSGETDGKKNFDADALRIATDSLTNDIIPLMTTLSVALPKVGGLSQFFSTLAGGRKYNFSDLGTQLSGLGKGLGDLGTNVNNDSWKNNEGFTNAFDAMDSILAVMIRIQQFQKDLGEYYNGFGAFNELVGFIEYLSDPNYDIVGKISSFMGNLNTAVSGWANQEDMDEIMSRMEAFKMFTEGLNFLISSATVSKEGEGVSSWSFIGNKFTDDIAIAITNGTESVLESVSTLLVNMQTKANTVDGVDWQQIGKNVVDGIALGINIEGEVTLWPSVTKMMNTAYEKGKEAIDSNSPSKLFMKLGTFMGEGTAIGIQKSTDLVGENAEQMSYVALENARDAVGLVSRIMAESTDATPTIAPILDMTNIDAGLAQFKDRLSGYGIALDTSNSAGRAAYIGTSGYEDPQALKPDYSGIYQQMDKLGNAIQKMGQDIRKMKLVLDTGAIAGGVADILDEEYGRRQFYESRE